MPKRLRIVPDSQIVTPESIPTFMVVDHNNVLAEDRTYKWMFRALKSAQWLPLELRWQGRSAAVVGANSDQFEPGIQYEIIVDVDAIAPVTLELAAEQPEEPGDEVVRPQPIVGEVALQRAHVPPTIDELLWKAIRASTHQLRYSVYEDFLDEFLSSSLGGGNTKGAPRLDWHLSNHGPYKLLQHATDVFVMAKCGVKPRPRELDREGFESYGEIFPPDLQREFERHYLEHVPGSLALGAHKMKLLPYLDIIRRKLGDVSSALANPALDSAAQFFQHKLQCPVMLELIWSYWHEEGMLVQTMNAITQRFQNVRPQNGRDPLLQLEIDPLRPMNQLLWGLVQDEPNRLSVLRRAHEYDHQYGFTLHGRAVSKLRSADRRSQFLESFHNLLYRCSEFYRGDDDMTVQADGFPVLNAVKETHYLLAHGAHNQFGDLPATARKEMLIQQYILSRPEMREFLGGRVMVPYAESWMDRVDVVKSLQGWTNTSVVHFRDLGVFGEQIILSVRYGAWSLVDTPANAANWARCWRAEIQGYIHAYRAVTGVDLTAEITDHRRASERFLPPSVHLRNRLLEQIAK